MLFSSAIFLFLFLPIVLFFYYLSPKKLKNLILLISSLFFYTWGEQQMVVLIIFSAFVDFSAGLFIKNGYRKVGLTFSVFFNLSILFYFKYAIFFFDNLSQVLRFFGNDSFSLEGIHVVLPLGISFYTFQTMSYTIDVYRGNVKASSNFIDFATYVSLFPQLIAGPIVRYSDVEKELEDRSTSIAMFSEGVRRFIIGLGKKMIVANNLAFVADGAFSIPITQLDVSFAWIGILAYTFQIYFDFSGYSDMAIGLGKMFGFNFPENFNFPYFSKSIREFWRRWHISLSTWFKDYLYITLGGNRKGEKRTYLNLLIVFFITGLWHGASWNFVVWGLWHGFFLLLERGLSSKYSFQISTIFKRLYLGVVVTVGWVLFRADSLENAISYLAIMFGFFEGNQNFELILYYLRTESILAFLLAFLLSFPIHRNLIRDFFNYLALGKTTENVIEKTFLLVVFFIAIVYVAVDAYNPFIYFRF
jgi:alginate O-acetyltransferase complex protein AlgI